MKSLLTIFITGFLLITYNGSATPPQFAEFTPSSTPSPAPNIQFQNSEGKTQQLSDYKGKIILLVFWATWCGPCVAEANALDNLSAKLKDQPFKLLALSQDHDLRVVEQFFKDKNLQATDMLFDRTGEGARAFGVQGIPTAFLLNEKGDIIGRHQGAAPWDSPAAIALINYYLKQMAPK
jgi:peroxiredoxin